MKILGADWTVKYMTEQDSNDTGDCDVRYQLIRIRKNLCEEYQQEILLHEIIEAINNKLELEIEHHKITCLGTALFSVMAENGIDLTTITEDIK